jgi:hypothetical protein
MKDLLLRCHQSIMDAELRFNNTQSSSINTSTGDSDEASHLHSVKPSGRAELPAALEGRNSSTEDGSRSCHISDRFFGKSSSFLSNIKRKGKERGRQGMVILIQLVTSNFRHLSLPRSKIVSVMLLVRLGLSCHDDDVVLKRVLPTLLVALTDSSSAVRALSVRALSALLSSVITISPFESNLFPQYLFAPLSTISRDADTSVRVAFAECLGVLAETSKRFLETSHLTALKKAVARADFSPLSSERNNIPADFDRAEISAGKDPASMDVEVKVTSGISMDTFHVEFLYDSKLKVLHDQVTRWIREVTSSAPSTSSNGGSQQLNSQMDQDTSRSANTSLIGKFCSLTTIYLYIVLHACIYMLTFGFMNSYINAQICIFIYVYV